MTHWLRSWIVLFVLLPLAVACSDGPTAPTLGSLSIAIAGVPEGLTASLRVTGPSGFDQTISSAQTLTNLAPGTYTVDAPVVFSGRSGSSPSPLSQQVEVVAGQEAVAQVAYGVLVPAIDLTVVGMYLTQSVQTFSGSVPLVRGRDGYLRVFAKTDDENSATPSVRVRFYHDGVLKHTAVIAAGSSRVASAVNEGDLNSSWNVLVPGSLIQPGLSVLAEVNPDGVVVEINRADNQFPQSGMPLAMDVRTLSPFRVMIVPVRQSDGSLGSVTETNKDQFLADLQRMLPVPGYDAQIRAPYTTTAPVIESNNGNGSWGTILSEINALRVAEANGRYYYGVLKASYRSGIAGMGYVPGKASIGWDYLPSGAGVFAHEIGHNWGRFHAPCGNVRNADTSFPHLGGTIGAYGFDVAAGALKAPGSTDLMGYCKDKWISDYTYTKVFTYRAAEDANSSTRAGSSQSSLLIWGRIGKDGLVLEPAFEVAAGPTLPQKPGAYSVVGLDAHGAQLFSLSFTGDEIADSPDGARQFAFAVPLTAEQKARVATLRLSGNGKQMVMNATAASTQNTQAGKAPPAVLQRLAGRMMLRWNQQAHPMVMVRDAETGQILSFARNGEVALGVEPGRKLDLSFSNRVRSYQQRVVVEQ